MLAVIERTEIMTVYKLDDRLFLNYLKILGVQKKKPNFEYLEEIIKAQMSKIPYKNISKLFYYKRNNLEQLND
jgi:arylamine N-acetyltransferase